MDGTDNSVDKSPVVGYNDSNLNDDTMIVVKMDEQKAINDIGCKHTDLLADPDDTIGDAVYHGCLNAKCGVGFYIKT